MDRASAFDFVASQLEERCQLSPFVARGTLRLALRCAGLDPHWVTWTQMQRAVEQVLAAELTKRAVADASGVCREIAELLEDQAGGAETGRPSPEDFLRRTRLGGRRSKSIKT